MSDQFRIGGDLPVHRLGFGAMRLPSSTGIGGEPRDPETGRRVLRRAVELGVDHIDTADFYRSGDGSVRANVLIREALHPYPENLVIATKVGPVFGPEGFSSAEPDGLRALVEANLDSLGVERLDLVYLRVGHMEPPHGESIAARFEVLAELREEGLIRHLGLSNTNSYHLAEANTIAPVAAVQNQYADGHRADAGVLTACERQDTAFVPFFPLHAGRSANDTTLAKVAARHSASPAEIGLAWLLASSPVTLAIPGTGSVTHLEQNMAAARIKLTDEDLADLA
ncbi:aldo/keto reductase [Streptomyces sp. OUCMDZ-4982]|uniref:aldo/keto reductase n=1 Tax=Streptomyces sp. OUCMDZ-4982 TaxID=2973090 RepID=UPI00215C733D|nr:aldo/keto reductase [Streptomyces sp. OUCMDZ-4982]MCR8945138.1 aldo/keto reductase [Streptomyces sp. OUCMDZ-4982]